MKSIVEQVLVGLGLNENVNNKLHLVQFQDSLYQYYCDYSDSKFNNILNIVNNFNNKKLITKKIPFSRNIKENIDKFLCKTQMNVTTVTELFNFKERILVTVYEK